MFGSDETSHKQGRSSADGGNGNVRDRSHAAAGRHSTIETPGLQAVRDLASGTPGYEGDHRGE